MAKSTADVFVVGNRTLKVFLKPDTASAPVQHIAPGSRHLILAYRSKSGPTMYAQISHGWVCIEWAGNKYGIVSALGEPGVITEDALLAEAALMTGWEYSLTDPRYPRQLPGIPSKYLARPNRTNCSCSVEAMVVGAAGGAHWDETHHADALILDASRPFSSADAYLCYAPEGIKEPLMNPADAIPHSVCQGVNERNGHPGVQYDDGDRGHTWYVWAVHEATGRILTFEANTYYQIQGFGHRGIGPYNGRGIPDKWWEDADCWTWAQFLDYYDGGIAVTPIHVQRPQTKKSVTKKSVVKKSETSV
jgi:hypothetical protein